MNRTPSCALSPQTDVLDAPPLTSRNHVLPGVGRDWAQFPVGREKPAVPEACVPVPPSPFPARPRCSLRSEIEVEPGCRLSFPKMAAGPGRRRRLLQLLMQFGSVLLTRCPFWGCFCQLMLYAERADARRKPDIPVPYLYFDMGAAVLCASFMSFGVKRRWFALGAALQLAVSTYAAYIGGYVHYGDWLKVRMYSRIIAIIGGFLVLASGAGELYRQKPRSRSLQSTGQVFLGIYLICVAYSLQHSKEDRLAYLNHIPGGELTLQLLFILYGILALAFLSGYYVALAAQILAVLLPLIILLIDGNIIYWHNTRRVEFWNQMKLIGENVGIFGAAVILATDG
ncbi:transmembrane protein 101 isoform X1 [Sarcophilus harrisii]|uniref:transmembrane protein 101 isoform X1 n=1 Tax=Sarcophilus harrisii TaxID=9305 RepID=UPI001301AEAA|nr:transmembrane protein 101 isoform X1 [Sarcophilus harrisii]XP_031821904.1 transmembrane protein 101 isoform X1 [Sarcophilus harrisii]XP_031821905.1 transmembrane protein 101 isoform X1 [Sarcophilus harrisii]